jgi:transposase
MTYKTCDTVIVRVRCFLVRTPATTALLARRFFGPHETRRVAGAGRRATGCRATECKSRAPVNELPARPPGKRHTIADNGRSSMGYCCGWGGSVHAVCVIDDADGHVVARFTIDHTAEGLAELRRRLDKIAPAATIPIAIERPSGLIVEALIQAGHPVVPIHPNVVKACRPRYRAAGGKSDPGDAYLLADVRRPSLPPAHPLLRRRQGAARAGPDP